MNNKKIIFRVTREYMKKNKRRTQITFLGILVMVILMTAVFVGKDTALQFMTDIVADDRGSWHAMVYDVNQEQVDAVRSLPYMKTVSVSRALGYTEFPQSGNPEETPFLEIKGYSSEIFPMLNINLVEGRYPETEEEIIISQMALQEDADVKIGDVLTVDAFDRYIHAYSSAELQGGSEVEDKGFIMFSSGFMISHGATEEVPAHFPYFVSNEEFEMIHKPTGFQKKVTVVGIMESPYYELPGMGGYMAFTASENSVKEGETVNLVLTTDLRKVGDISADLNRIVNMTKTPEEIVALLENGTSTVTKSGERIPVEQGRVEVNDLLLLFASKGTDEGLNMIIAFLQAFFIILITAASLVLIYNVFSISFRERSRYLGMLSSIGATRSQKRWSVYYEVFLLLAIALPLGILLGLAVVAGGMALLKPYFTRIMGMIAKNVITGKSVDMKVRLIVRPSGLLLTALFSAVAVFISALIPARKISKIGPVEGIRGNDEIIAKSRKSLLSLMKKGKAEALLSAASVSRNRFSTRGIIRSISALIILTLVTAFAANMISDVVRNKTENYNIMEGPVYSDHEYYFEIGEDALYEEGKNDIMTSDEVTSYKELRYYYGGLQIRIEDLSDEYRKVFEQYLLKFFPQGIPEIIDTTMLHPAEVASNPDLSRLVVSDEDFEKIARSAHLDTGLASLESPGAIVYSRYSFDSSKQMITYGGAVDPGYIRFELTNPLSCQVGETIPSYLFDYTSKDVTNIPLTFLGYADDNDIREYASIKDGEIWIIISEKTNEWILQHSPDGYTGLEIKGIYLNAANDSKIIKRLANIKDSFDNSALRATAMFGGAIDFKTAVSRIIDIMAVCFTLLVAIISLLNLYNSVMGRRLARHKELAVIQSIGMTHAQRQKMLALENIRLLAKSFVYGGVITTGFVVLLHKVVSDRFGKLQLSMPIWVIIATLALSVFALLLFTNLCYRDATDQSLIEEVRSETV